MSYIRADVLSAANGTSATTLTGQWASKAWVNFAGATATTGASGNISSVTRNGQGDWTVNFSNALVDNNYAFAGGVQYSISGSRSYQNIVFDMWDGAGYVTSSSIRFSTSTLQGTTTYDTTITTITIVR